MSLYDEFSKKVQQYAPAAFELNYAIANDPELSGEEYHACARHIAACRDAGMDVTERFSGQAQPIRRLPAMRNRRFCG